MSALYRLELETEDYISYLYGLPMSICLVIICKKNLIV
jgi:hypothetical protein